MNLEEWRKKKSKGHDLPLPSGLTVQVRKFTVMDLVVEGDVPKELDAAVVRFINGDMTVRKASDVTGVAKLTLLVAQGALLGPGDLAAEELPVEDLQHIFQWCHSMGGGSASGSFRDQQNGAVGTA